MSLRHRVTCMIPTHNRPFFLRRWLAHHSRFPFKFTIRIVDSSNAENAAQNQAAIDSFAHVLDINYQHIDEANCLRKTEVGLAAIRTPYVAMCADDDVLFSHAVEQCAAFLDTSPDYVAATGRTATVYSHRPNWWCRIYPRHSISGVGALARCREYAAAWFPNFYSCHRTDLLLNCCRSVNENVDWCLGYFLPEQLLSHLCLIEGKLKVLPVTLALIEHHQGNASRDWTRVYPQQQEVAQEQFDRFQRTLSNALVAAGENRSHVDAFIAANFGMFERVQKIARRRTLISRLTNGATALRDRIADCFSTDQARRRKRFVLSSDLRGIEIEWSAGLKMIGAFPAGMSLEQFTQLMNSDWEDKSGLQANFSRPNYATKSAA